MLFLPSLRRGLLFVPLLLFGLAAGLPYYSARLSLAMHGLPFAQIVPERNLNVFQFVEMDNLASRGIVFAGGRAVGWVCETIGTLPIFVPFGEKPSLDVSLADLRQGHPMVIAYYLRWWLLVVQAGVLSLVFWKRDRIGGCSVPLMLAKR